MVAGWSSSTRLHRALEAGRAPVDTAEPAELVLISVEDTVTEDATLEATAQGVAASDAEAAAEALAAATSSQCVEPGAKSGTLLQ
jgi:hypothetical protein